MWSDPLWLSQPFVCILYWKVRLCKGPCTSHSPLQKPKNKPPSFNTMLLQCVKVRAHFGKCKLRLQVWFSVFIAWECWMNKHWECYCCCSILFLASWGLFVALNIRLNWLGKWVNSSSVWILYFYIEKGKKPTCTRFE